MPYKQHVVTLTPTQRVDLQARLCRGAVPALTQTRARILLHADTGPRGPRRTDAQIAAAVGCSIRSVARARAAWTERGLGCLARRPSRNPSRPKLDRAAEARLIALTTGAPPTGHARWTVRLLTARAVELGIAATLSRETVRRTLKKTSSNPGAPAAS
jgi:hypothetical protein